MSWRRRLVYSVALVTLPALVMVVVATLIGVIAHALATERKDDAEGDGSRSA